MHFDWKKDLKKKKKKLPIKAKAWVQVVIETTKLGTEEQDKLTLRPSAKSTKRLPLGQIMWSTWVRTFSQVKSWVFSDMTSISVLEWPMLQTMHPFFILSMCSLVTTDLLPDAVITMSTLFTTLKKNQIKVKRACWKKIGLFLRTCQFLLLGSHPCKPAKHKWDLFPSHKQCNPWPSNFGHSLCPLVRIRKLPPASRRTWCPWCVSSYQWWTPGRSTSCQIWFWSRSRWRSWLGQGVFQIGPFDTTDGPQLWIPLQFLWNCQPAM